MSQIRFGASEPFAYQAAQWTYDLPKKAEKALTPKLGERVSRFIGNQLKSDFSQYTSVSLGPVKALLAEPPRLPLLLLLYPGTVGPRLYRAYQRGKENNDFREMGDVLRRDLTAITLFVFALAPLVYGVSKFTQSKTGVNLVKPKEGGMLSYSDFRNYKIDNPQALWQVVKEGNGEGLQKAINALNDGGLQKTIDALDNVELKQKYAKAPVADALNQLKQSVKNFVKTHAPKPDADINKKAALDAAEKTFEKFNLVDKSVENALNLGKEDGSKQILKIATRLQGQAKGALENYAKVRRLPSDMLSFAVLIAFIGWFPMWINGVWNKRQFEKKQAMKAQAPAPAVEKSPVLPAPTLTPTFRQQAIPFQPALNPFASPALAQRPMNPFIR
ncbi:hypothetical protein [Vampirovibrio chlorellavorus]|uniref:hypothetical protein n=1 Tax=Vampirovibrio chlorellavorus TaxID=758823 RepID=UPI0026EF589D|nr:hypothetical protein [Vampirovibrio chlorellavorus]